MKKIVLKVAVLFVLVAATAASAFAQGAFAYQAVIRKDGNVVSNQKVGMRFTLSSDKQAYYSETQEPTTNAYGNVSVMVGAGTKVSGDFMKVPWNSMNVMLKIEVDAAGGNNYIELGEIQLQPVPYAYYAKQAGGAKQASTASPDDAIFEVKDKDGQVVFAVYPDGVKVYVDDTEEAPKAKRSGLVVTGRKATKDDESADYFAVNAEGTQIFVDEDETGKAKRSGLVVTGRKATKDDELNTYLAVDGEGTHVYVDEDSDKAKRSGFVVTGRKATKGETPDLFKIDGAGTQVFIDEDADSKAKRSGFVVTGRKATKDGETADYFAVNADGTQVIVDEPDSKAKRSGFVVTGRKATKDGETADVLAIDAQGTIVYINDEDAKVRSGLIVTGRKATKDGEANEYMEVSSKNINFSSKSFNVANNGNRVLSVTNGNVHVNSDILHTGEIGKVVAEVDDYESITAGAWQNANPDIYDDGQFKTLSAADIFENGYGELSFARIIDNKIVETQDAIGSFLFNASGEPTDKEDEAVIEVFTGGPDNDVIIAKLDANATIAAGTTIQFAVKLYDYDSSEYYYKAIKVAL